MFTPAGDPRRPYPLDFVMRRGILGQLSQQSHSSILADDELGKSRHSSVIDEQSTMKSGAIEPQKATYNIGNVFNCCFFYLLIATLLLLRHLLWTHFFGGVLR